MASDLLTLIDHPKEDFDITYENIQARSRTLVLLSLANQYGGIVLGTSDLSEIALGWSTFGGDHLAMYQINSGLPKTLVRSVLEFLSKTEFSEIRDLIDSVLINQLVQS